MSPVMITGWKCVSCSYEVKLGGDYKVGEFSHGRKCPKCGSLAVYDTLELPSELPKPRCYEDKPPMKHGDLKESFKTGAKRDFKEGYGRPSLISPIALYRLAIHLERGAKHYEDRNWEKGMPFTRCIDSLTRHIIAFGVGDDTEDHLAAILSNAMFLAHYEEGIKSGNLPTSLDDRDSGTKNILQTFLTTLGSPPKIGVTGKVTRAHKLIGGEDDTR